MQIWNDVKIETLNITEKYFQFKKRVTSKNEIITTLINKQNKSKSHATIRTNLKIPTNHNYDTDFLATNGQVANALSKFRNHPSIIMIKSKRKTDQCFSFGPVTYDIIFKKIFLTLLKHLNNLTFQLRLQNKIQTIF